MSFLRAYIYKVWEKVPWREVFAWLPIAGILMVIYSLPYHYNEMQRMGLYLTGVGYISDYLVNARWRGWCWSKDKWGYIFFILFYLCVPIRQLFDPLCTWSFETKVVDYLPFLILGMAGIMGYKTHFKIEWIGITMLLSCCQMGIILLTHYSSFDYSSWMSWQNSLGLILPQYIHTHMVINLYCNIALIFGVWILFHSSYPRWFRGFLIVIMGLVATGVFVSNGRTGQVTLIILLVILLCYRFFHKARSWMLWLLAIVLISGVFAFVHFNPRYHDASVQDNPRLYIWKVSEEVIKEKPIFGWGVSSARQQFIEVGRNNPDFCVHYQQEFEGISMFLSGKVDYQLMHPHNVFLETWMELGIIGLFFLLCCIVLPLWLLPIGIQRYYLGACIFVIVIQSMFESFGRDLNPIWLPLVVIMWHYLSLSRSLPQSERSAVQPL